MADLAVRRLDVVADDVADAAQVRVGGFLVGAGRGFFFSF